MELAHIVEIVNGRVICGEEKLRRTVTYGFSSDLMSDVLTINIEDLMLITGLTNPQTIRTAEMADIEFILFVRNKKITPEMIKLAKENDMVLIVTGYSLFRTSGLLYNAGLKPVY
jgi:predicted transcriptional regulator